MGLFILSLLARASFFFGGRLNSDFILNAYKMLYESTCDISGISQQRTLEIVSILACKPALLIFGRKTKGLGGNGKKSLHGTYCVLIPLRRKLRRKLRRSDLIGLYVDDA